MGGYPARQLVGQEISIFAKRIPLGLVIGMLVGLIQPWIPACRNVGGSTPTSSGSSRRGLLCSKVGRQRIGRRFLMERSGIEAY